MKTLFFYIIVFPFFFCLTGREVSGQNSNTWTLNKCILYALEHNIQVKQSLLTTDINKVTLEQTSANRLPIVSGNIRQNYGWNDLLNQQGTTSNYTFTGSNNSSYSVNSSAVLYNGSKITNIIKQSDINYQAGKFNSETMKESISLNVLNAFLNLLFSEEQVKNNANQIEVT